MNDQNEIHGPSSSPETGLLTKALAAAQAAYPLVAYDSSNPHFKSKFASYAQCCESLRGPLTANGLSLPDFRPGVLNGQWVLLGTLRHVSGQYIQGVAPLLMGKQDMQGFGAAVTYAKRTLLMALCGGFAGEPDLDGEDTMPAKPLRAPPKGGMDQKALAYMQGAINAVQEAKDEAAAKKHLDTVELRAREKAIPVDVFHRVKEAFDGQWKKEVTNGKS
jgi:hypothetical protein